MSSNLELSSDLESSNPFEGLSDYPILHICSYLPGSDLLHLSEMDKKLKGIITESAETMNKIRLVLDLEFDDGENLDLDYVIKLAQARRFTSLRLKSVYLTDVKAKAKLSTLLELLSCSVGDLIVEGETSGKLLSYIIASFLPKLKKCKLNGVETYADATPTNEEISHQNNVNHPLQSLELKDTHALEVLHLFAGCNQLKTFRYKDDSEYCYSAGTDIEHMNNLLAKQDHLEKLEYHSTFSSAGVAWNGLRCFKLKELKAFCSPDTDDEHAAAKFLKKLPKLTKLDIEFYNQPSGSLMKAISEIPKLEKLTIRSSENKDKEEYEDEDAHEILVNHTVKKLEISEETGITAKLLKIFLGIESVYLDVGANELDLSDIPPETIGKIKLCKGYWKNFDVKFSTIDIPTNVETFQSAVMKFAESFAEFIVGIEIGHLSWRNSGEFRVSNSFCQDLVNQLPELCKLEIYNVADRGRFIAFLVENEDRLSLEDVKIHEPFGVGEPKPKKMKIQAD